MRRNKAYIMADKIKPLINEHPKKEKQIRSHIAFNL